MRLIVIIWIFCTAGMCIAAEDDIITVSPEKPVWGETLEVRYDLHHPKSVFELGDKVFAVYFVYNDRGGGQKWTELQSDGDFLKGKIKVERGTSFFTFYFTSMEKADTRENKSLMVYEKEGRPARGAFHNAMLQLGTKDDYSDYFEKEREYYPDNFAVFRDLWFIAGAYDKENQLSRVAEDLKILSEIKTDSPSLLFARNYGLLLQGREAESRAIIRRMVEKFSGSTYTGHAVSDYDYQVFSQQLKGEGPKEVAELKKKLCTADLDSSFARRQLPVLVGDEKYDPLNLFNIIKPWLMDEPDNPLPHYLMARTFFERENNAEAAAGEIETALRLLLQGKLRFFMDIYGKMTEIYLPRYFKLSSDIALSLEKKGRAMAHILAAQAVLKEALPDYKAAEGDIWIALDRPVLAEKAYLEAYQLGDKNMIDKLKNLFSARFSTDEGFDEYLAKLLETPKPTGKKQKKQAPDFDVKTLSGETLRLSDLKGKVVVLNFWFVGCAPCHVEIPGLNKLVEEYGDKDVVFIAFALNKADALRPFLKEKPFNYRIVPEGESAVKPYDVSVFPTHIIIDRDGNIAYRLTGGSPDRHEQLRPLIDNLLR